MIRRFLVTLYLLSLKNCNAVIGRYIISSTNWNHMKILSNVILLLETGVFNNTRYMHMYIYLAIASINYVSKGESSLIKIDLLCFINLYL